MIASSPEYMGKAICPWCGGRIHENESRTYATARLLVTCDVPHAAALMKRDGKKATVGMHMTCAQLLLDDARQRLQVNDTLPRYDGGTTKRRRR